MSTHLEIAGRRIGAGEPVYIIAELSANHGQKPQAVTLSTQRMRGCRCRNCRPTRRHPDDRL